MMLLTPSWSMKLIICFCAPAVMESMATTAPTPKIMPSMVNRLRSLCAMRLESPMNSSGKTLPKPILFPSPAAGRHHGTSALLFTLLLLAGLLRVGVGQGHNLVRLHAAAQHHG